MTKKYQITIKELDPYEVKDVQYEAIDGRVYASEYSVPKDTKFKKVSYATGATKYNERECFSQEVDDLNLVDVIKAINKITS